MRRPLRFGSLVTLIATELPRILTRMGERHPEVRMEVVRAVTRAELREHEILLGSLDCVFHQAADRYFGSHARKTRLPSVFVAVSWAARDLGAVLVPELAS